MQQPQQCIENKVRNLREPTSVRGGSEGRGGTNGQHGVRKGVVSERDESGFQQPRKSNRLSFECRIY